MVQFKRPKRTVDGVLFLDKPTGVSSNHALQVAKRTLRAAKAGHTGTLDPLASGLLPLTFGQATKFSHLLLNADKVYETRLQFGIETTTGDAEGSILSQQSVCLEEAKILDALTAFRGEIEQIPPMHSALKHAGRPLYEYAREGIELEREVRHVKILELTPLEIGPDFCQLRVHCSKGTYIRTLGIDIGRTLGCGAHLTQLRRTGIGEFNLSNAITLETLEKASFPEGTDALLSPVDTLVQHFPALKLNALDAEWIRQGRVIASTLPHPGIIRLYDAQNNFMGLGENTPNVGVRPVRLCAEPSSPRA